MSDMKSFRFSIDRGGTFTDIFCEIRDSRTQDTLKVMTLKLLSEDPSNYKDAPTEGIRRVLEQETGKSYPRDSPVATSQIEYIRMGTTVATNALLERKGERIALLTTSGFKDLQIIGNQSRPKIFDLEIRRPELLYEIVCEVDERVILLKTPKDVQNAKRQFNHDSRERIVTGVSKDNLVVETPLDIEGVREQLKAVRDSGITSVAIVFMHSYTFTAHEKQAKAIAEELGFTQISLSSEVMPMVRIVPRGCTTCVDAYLTPIIKKYLTNFRSGFDKGLDKVQVSFMQSDGGLTPMHAFSGNRAILSGPAGGVVGYARTSYHHDDGPAAADEAQSAVIGFDMGGTSTDVSRYDGVYEHVFETVTAGVTVQCPQLDINTVAAGGGSRLFYRNGLFVVGPESAGAHPGPVCYRKGGHLAVTDANVMLGRIQPHLFPAIFGPNENEQLDFGSTQAAFEAITREVNEASKKAGGAAERTYSVDEVAYGFIRVANEAMARPIRNLTTMKGHNVTKHALACFGGAGPQHCCAIAKSLGMRKIYVHRYSGILSAYGLGLADVVVEKQEPFSGEAIAQSRVLLQAEAELDRLEGQASEELLARGFPQRRIQCTRYLNCRYQGTDTCIMVSLPQPSASSSSSLTSSRVTSRATSRSSSIGEPPVEGGDEDDDSASVPVPPPPPSTPITLPSSPTLSPNESDSESTTGSRDGKAGAPPTRNFFNRFVDRVQKLGLGRPRLPSVDMTLSSLKNRFGVPAGASDYEAEFTARYRREYGFELADRPILVEDVRVRAVGKSPPADIAGGFGGVTISVATGAAPAAPPPKEVVQVYFEPGGRQDTPVHYLRDLPAGASLVGPVIIVQDVATVVVEPNCTAVVSPVGDLEITVLEAKDASVTTELDPIYLSIFGHRFMGIAEQMGRTLQRTSISVNIKERLDFSCALFDPKGGLVANAPHLPVHLGAMSEAVRYQIKHWGADLKEGDVLVSNHPQLAGGSHLPDITVITPVFHKDTIQFFVASRGHHADVGGISPGSMPPLSKSLQDEGAAIVAFKLVQGGSFQERGITALLQAPGSLPRNSGTRNLSDNLSDLRAQVAANTRGVQLMTELVGEYGLDVVKAYMEHIQDCAEASVRHMLSEFSRQRGLPERGQVHAEDFLDDGTPIRLSIEIDRAQGSAVFDFSGSGAEMYANLNAPPAVTSSAIIYCMRCLLPSSDIPLNQGCLTPITIKIPQGCVLNPSPQAAVVGGNVLTSQRVTDVVLRAFEACAASQGCMNNLTFGNASMGYYETIAGGAGAGPNWHGCSGVQTHMTNTRLTDAEILEKRYPAILRKFGLRRGSGGKGYYCGGDGVDRVLEFTEDLAVSILSERRAFQPYGLRGGQPGSRGINLLHIPASSEAGTGTGKVISLGGKNTVQVHKGWALQVLSPGGGGYGEERRDGTTAPAQKEPLVLSRTSGSLNQYTMNQESV
jgi:N-methylhydantoinase A/oxoprolinase/acetone carboxylase beta subunit/N-methylhydantoinase B/oxoprolinase/acetone carboxylase alpha subunit